ncbi:MAG: erythromycin esterase family protein [Saprospiraceae bacterium]
MFLINKPLFLLICWLLPALLTAQDFLKEADDYLYPFQKVESKNLANFIKEIAADKRIIGLGEVSHFTKDCYDLKSAIIHTLIEEGYDGLVLEVDFGQALIWNDYLVSGEGNLDSIVAQSGWFTYRTEEFKSLLANIRAYNKTSEQAFQVFGMEMTAVNHNISWLQAYFKNILPENHSIFERLAQERNIVAFGSFNATEQSDYWTLFTELNTILMDHQDQLKAEKGAAKYAIAQRITEIMRQFATYIAQDDYGLKGEFRDQFSARNVYWCMQQLGADSKIAIWAHNGHVAKTSILFNYDVLGHYLEQWFGEAYYAIGFNWNKGAFGAFSNEGFKRWEFEEVSEPSLSRDFAALNANYVLLDVRRFLAKEPAPDHFFRQAIPARSDMSESYNESRSRMMEINLSKTFDAYIYIHDAKYPSVISWLP